ncbi:hypothetical protein IMSAGC009_03617 [Lachnospiraceae bacterium]|nr:hypothetical protein IMSAGC009_03617 [Lachnospiraceae bacterium]
MQSLAAFVKLVRKVREAVLLQIIISLCYNNMCAELEMAGLKEPEYHTNAFMLQAIFYKYLEHRKLQKYLIFHMQGHAE